jgi:hypothetical protein
VLAGIQVRKLGGNNARKTGESKHVSLGVGEKIRLSKPKVRIDAMTSKP